MNLINPELYSTNESYTCCCPLSDNSIIIGTSLGRILRGNLMDIKSITNYSFSNEKMVKVLNDDLECIFKFNLSGGIRAINTLDEKNLIILSELGCIALFNKSLKEFNLIQKCIGGKYNKYWRILVLDKNNFITIGNYRQIKHWKKIGSQFVASTLSKNGSALFCLEWYNKEKKIFFTNDYSGKTDLWIFENNKVRNINSFYIDGNLQKSIILDDDYIIATHYRGRIYIYKKIKNSLERIEEFSISLRLGNYVHFSNELNMILIGTNDNLILLNKDFSQVYTIGIEVKQIFTINGIDLILTSRNIVRANYDKKFTPPELQKYKYIKIGLIGESQVGKTCFCEYLESNEFRETDSSFGKHVWTIYYENRNRLLLYDLAGQESEIFTYFPMIKDSDIILIFYQAIKSTTFDQAVDYYLELKHKCPQAKFYFIQAFSDQKERVRDFYVKGKFEEIGLDYDENLIKVSSKEGTGFEEFYAKIIDKFDWNNAHGVIKLNIYDIVEKKIHQFYKENVESISLDDMWEEVRIIDKFRLETIIESYYEQGMIEYIKDEKEIIINDEEYAIMHSDIAEYTVQKSGYVYTKELLRNLGENEKKEKYIKNILKYYKENGIGIFFKEDDPSFEVLIITRKLNTHFRIPDDINKSLPKFEISFEYIEKELSVDPFLHFMSQFPLKLIQISKNQVLFQILHESDLSFINIKIDLPSESSSSKICSISVSKNKKLDFDIEKKSIDFIVDMIGEQLINLKTDEAQEEIEIVDDPLEELKILLNSPSERSYLDFKVDLNLSNKREKAKFIRNLIALTNSSYTNNNKAYLIIGIAEKSNKILRIENVKNTSTIEQKISNLIDKFINIAPEIECITIDIGKLYEWQENNEISQEIPFSRDQQKKECRDKILLIKIKRNSGCVYEISKKISFQDTNGKPKHYPETLSWFRISSHTYIARENLRQMLRRI